MKIVLSIVAPSKSEKVYEKHRTQKPIKLLVMIILSSTKEREPMFDPFSGCNTTGVSAIRNNRRFLGYEVD